MTGHKEIKRDPARAAMDMNHARDFMEALIQRGQGNSSVYLPRGVSTEVLLRLCSVRVGDQRGQQVQMCV